MLGVVDNPLSVPVSCVTSAPFPFPPSISMPSPTLASHWGLVEVEIVDEITRRRMRSRWFGVWYLQRQLLLRVVGAEILPLAGIPLVQAEVLPFAGLLVVVVGALPRTALPLFAKVSPFLLRFCHGH